MYKELKTAKSRMTIYKIVAFIVVTTLLIYLHDLIPKGSGKIGKSSLRVYFYTVNSELRFLLVWFLVYALAKGKVWRFVIWLPILMTTYQLLIRIFSLQTTAYNDFNLKFVISLLVFIALIVFYFYRKRKDYTEE